MRCDNNKVMDWELKERRVFYLENGIKIMVPPFINSDDKIILDTRTLEYIKKIK